MFGLSNLAMQGCSQGYYEQLAAQQQAMLGQHAHSISDPGHNHGFGAQFNQLGMNQSQAAEFARLADLQSNAFAKRIQTQNPDERLLVLLTDE